MVDKILYRTLYADMLVGKKVHFPYAESNKAEGVYEIVRSAVEYYLGWTPEAFITDGCDYIDEKLLISKLVNVRIYERKGAVKQYYHSTKSMKLMSDCYPDRSIKDIENFNGEDIVTQFLQGRRNGVAVDHHFIEHNFLLKATRLLSWYISEVLIPQLDLKGDDPAKLNREVYSFFSSRTAVRKSFRAVGLDGVFKRRYFNYLDLLYDVVPRNVSNKKAVCRNAALYGFGKFTAFEQDILAFERKKIIILEDQIIINKMVVLPPFTQEKLSSVLGKPTICEAGHSAFRKGITCYPDSSKKTYSLSVNISNTSTDDRCPYDVYIDTRLYSSIDWEKVDNNLFIKHHGCFTLTGISLSEENYTEELLLESVIIECS